MTTFTILILALAIVLGIFVNHRILRTTKMELSGIKLDLLVSPLVTLTTLLLAFVLVQVFSSYNRAKLSAGDEAGQVIAEFQQFGYLDDEYGLRGQAAVLCYSRAVTEIEWSRLTDGIGVVPEVTHWGLEISRVLTELASVRTSQPYGSILATDRSRTDARRRRISETRPAVPEPVSWLMLVVSATAILAIASFTPDSVERRIQCGALVLLAVVFAAMQIAILEIDSKYDGWIRVDPDEMRLVAPLVEERFAAQHPDYTLPCDSQGLAL